VERAKVFARLAIRIPSVIETDRSNRQLVTQAGAKGVTHVVNSGFLGRGKEIAGIEKQCALEFAVDRKCVFDIEDGVELAADRISFGIERAERALAETADAGRAAVEKALVNRERCWFIGTGVIERVNRAGAGPESERLLLKPALQRRRGLIFNNYRRQRFRPEGQEIRNAAGASDELDFAAECS